MLIKHYSDEELASALERKYELSITPEAAHCYVNQLNLSGDVVCRRWLG